MLLATSHGGKDIAANCIKTDAKKEKWGSCQHRLQHEVYCAPTHNNPLFFHSLGLVAGTPPPNFLLSWANLLLDRWRGSCRPSVCARSPQSWWSMVQLALNNSITLHPVLPAAHTQRGVWRECSQEHWWCSVGLAPCSGVSKEVVNCFVFGSLRQDKKRVKYCPETKV